MLEILQCGVRTGALGVTVAKTVPPLRLPSIVIGSATHTSQTRVCSLVRCAVNQHGGERVDVISSVNQGNPSILRVAGVAIDVHPPSPLENKARLQSPVVDTRVSGGTHRYDGCF